LSLTSALAAMTMPVLLFCGDQDQRHAAVANTAQELPNAQFVSLSGVTHLGGVMHPELLLPAVIAFLKDN
jgi:pimeloyl-ACP methyl ester carboxylesterase